jgi:hypothetical protein
VLLGELRVRGHRELVITLAGLGRWHPQLARVLAHARIRYLVDGAHVELHDLPDALALALGSGLPTAFLVVDTTLTDPSATLTPPARRRERRPSPGPRTLQDGTRE